MTEELKPCPFCGNKAHIVEIFSGGIGIISYSVSCNDIHYCIAGDPMKYFPTEGMAVEAWNRRADDEFDGLSILKSMTIRRDA